MLIRNEAAQRPTAAGRRRSSGRRVAFAATAAAGLAGLLLGTLGLAPSQAASAVDNQSCRPDGINTFADSAVAFIEKYGFNGVDLDYEYPTSMNNAGNPLDWTTANAKRGSLMKGYAALLQTMRQKLDRASAADGKYYLLSVAAPSSGYLLRGGPLLQQQVVDQGRRPHRQRCVGCLERPRPLLSR